jgi:hypothetical protein
MHRHLFQIDTCHWVNLSVCTQHDLFISIKIWDQIRWAYSLSQEKILDPPSEYPQLQTSISILLKFLSGCIFTVIREGQSCFY